MKTFLDALKHYGKSHDFNKPLGTLAKPIAINKLSEYFKENTKLKFELQKCANVTQMANTIQQLTGELTKERTPAQITEFNASIERLIKLARL